MQHTVQHTSVAACLNIVERNERFPRFPDETISSKINNNRDPSIGYIGYTRDTRRDTIGEKLQSISRVCESHDVVQVRHTRMIIIMPHRSASPEARRARAANHRRPTISSTRVRAAYVIRSRACFPGELITSQNTGGPNGIQFIVYHPTLSSVQRAR